MCSTCHLLPPTESNELNVDRIVSILIQSSASPLKDVEDYSTFLSTATLMSSLPFSLQVFQIMLFQPHVRRSGFCSCSMIRIRPFPLFQYWRWNSQLPVWPKSRKSWNFLFRQLVALAPLYIKALPNGLFPWFPCPKQWPSLGNPDSIDVDTAGCTDERTVLQTVQETELSRMMIF